LTYQIKIGEFEGPFDLLLYFIERDELDIHDIPIARITDDFLKYMRSMEELDIDLASEFILVAATLVRIKSKMLLPRKELDELGNEIDPREDLVKKLLEYKRFKEVLSDFVALEEIQLMREKRGNAVSELKQLSQKALVEAELESVSLYRLFEVFTQLMQESEMRGKRVVHRVFKYPYSTEEQRTRIFRAIHQKGKVDFKNIFETLENRIHGIFIFLVVLEMVNQREVDIVNGDGPNSFWLLKPEVAVPE
jgi:segregation and condensation protein A